MPAVAEQTSQKGDSFELLEFGKFQSGQLTETVSSLLEECKILLSNCITGNPSWQAVYKMRERVERRLELMSLGEFLLDVCFSPELAEEVAQVSLKIALFKLRLRHDRSCYDSLVSIRDSPEWNELRKERREMIVVYIKESINYGIELCGSDLEELKQIVEELEQLRIIFNSNERQAIKNDASLKGLVSDSHDRSQREEAHRLLITRAASGEFDNRQVCERIRQARHRQARLLDHDHYAGMQLGRHLDSIQETLSISAKLLRSHQAIELELLSMLASHKYGSSTVRKWDYKYLSRIRDEIQGEATDAMLRPYFQHDIVLNGFFALCYQLFGIEFVPAESEVPAWHEDVQFFRVLENDQEIGLLLYDPFERSGSKAPGAWASIMPVNCEGLPVSIIVCNFNDSHSSLMNLYEVETLFHEFGHFLQGVFQTRPGLSSIGNEISSNFMECWLNDLHTLKRISCHIRTGEPLPDSLCEQIIDSKRTRQLMSIRRLTELGLLDLHLHSDSLTPLTRLQNHASDITSVIPVTEGDYSYCTARHLFRHEGYSARYFARYYTGMIYADKAFEVFKQATSNSELAELGQQFRETVFARSGPELETNLVDEFVEKNKPKQKLEPD